MWGLKRVCCVVCGGGWEECVGVSAHVLVGELAYVHGYLSVCGSPCDYTHPLVCEASYVFRLHLCGCDMYI